jgi:hypothetical protein|tara:strand:- start:406 stop:624 length:219 start_codon:yes stop_codon:yes gene_type:complete
MALQTTLLSLSNPEIERALQIVARSLEINRELYLSPEVLKPLDLSHLTPPQWEELLKAHLYLLWQRENSLLH